MWPLTFGCVQCFLVDIPLKLALVFNSSLSNSKEKKKKHFVLIMHYDFSCSFITILGGGAECLLVISLHMYFFIRS